MNFNSKDFNIDESAIDRELCQLGSKMFEYGQEEGKLKVGLEQAKSNLEFTEAVVDTDIRFKAKTEGTKKTEVQLKNEILLSDLYKSALVKYEDAQKNYNLVKAAMVALSAKRDCLIALSYRDRQLMKADVY